MFVFKYLNFNLMGDHFFAIVEIYFHVFVNQSMVLINPPLQNGTKKRKRDDLESVVSMESFEELKQNLWSSLNNKSQELMDKIILQNKNYLNDISNLNSEREQFEKLILEKIEYLNQKWNSSTHLIQKRDSNKNIENIENFSNYVSIQELEQKILELRKDIEKDLFVKLQVSKNVDNYENSPILSNEKITDIGEWNKIKVNYDDQLKDQIHTQIDQIVNSYLSNLKTQNLTIRDIDSIKSDLLEKINTQIKISIGIALEEMKNNLSKQVNTILLTNLNDNYQTIFNNDLLEWLFNSFKKHFDIEFKDIQQLKHVIEKLNSYISKNNSMNNKISQFIEEINHKDLIEQIKNLENNYSNLNEKIIQITNKFLNFSGIEEKISNIQANFENKMNTFNSEINTKFNKISSNIVDLEDNLSIFMADSDIRLSNQCESNFQETKSLIDKLETRFTVQFENLIQKHIILEKNYEKLQNENIQLRTTIEQLTLHPLKRKKIEVQDEESDEADPKEILNDKNNNFNPGAPIVMFSGFKVNTKYDFILKEKLETIVNNLGGTITTDFIGDTPPTHVVSPPEFRSLKTVLASISNIYICKAEWLLDCKKAGKFIDSESNPHCKRYGRKLNGVKVGFTPSFSKEDNKKKHAYTLLNLGGGEFVENLSKCEHILCSKKEKDSIFEAYPNSKVMDWLDWMAYLYPVKEKENR